MSCLLCGCTAAPTEICRTGFASIVRCISCGLVRTWPPRSRAELEALHSDAAYFFHPYFGARRDLGREALRKKHRDLLRSLIGSFTTKNLKLLDVGCDTGGLLTVARYDFGMEVMGVEISPTAAEVARSQRGLDVRVGELIEQAFPAESFDVITLMDVIEHVPDPAALLSETRRLLRPGGRLYIATADHNALINALGLVFYRLLGRISWPLLEKLYIPVHEFYFTRNTLRRLVQQARFHIIYHCNREFPLDEFGHGFLLKVALVPIFFLQKILNRQTLQEIVAVNEKN